MKTFKLLNLPSVAQRNVLRVMTPQDVFFLTLFYPKFRKIAKSIRWFDCNSSKISIDSSKDGMFWLSLTTPDKTIYLIRFCASPMLVAPKIREIGDRKFRLSIQPSHAGQPQKIICFTHDQDLLWALLETNFTETFGKLPAIDVDLLANQVGHFPKTGTIRRLVLKNGTITAKDLEKFCETHKVKQNITVAAKVHGNISENNSELLKVDELNLFDATWLFSGHLQNFRGRHLNLGQTELETLDVIRFMKNWCKSCSKLETLMITVGLFDEQRILREMRVKRWDPMRRAAIYVSTSECKIGPDNSTTIYDCTDAWDIERESDGLLASFKVRPTQFMFFVWNKSFP